MVQISAEAIRDAERAISEILPIDLVKKYRAMRHAYKAEPTYAELEREITAQFESKFQDIAPESLVSCNFSERVRTFTLQMLRLESPPSKREAFQTFDDAESKFKRSIPKKVRSLLEKAGYNIDHVIIDCCDRESLKTVADTQKG